MTSDEAKYFRKHFINVYACAICVNQGKARRYWWQDQLRITGSRNYCPAHFAELVGPKDSRPISDMD